MYRKFMKLLNLFRSFYNRASLNTRERVIIFFQKIYENQKYNEKKMKKVWKSVKLTKEQKRSIKKFYKENYGKNISYKYHRLCTAYTGNFDEKYVPDMIYTPYIERFVTDPSYGNVFTNKNTLSVFARGLNVKMPKNIIMRNKCRYYDENFNHITLSEAEKILYNVGKVFVKGTTNSHSGRGCFVANFVNGINVDTNKSVAETLKALGTDFAIQEILVCHESIAKVYPYSVNTFRIITYILEGEVYHCPIIMRIGIGRSNIDNACAGGMFIAVDDDGTLHKSAFRLDRTEYVIHPDTNLTFEGHKIENLDKAIKTAEKLQFAIPQAGVVNWDFTINDKGEAVLLEANLKNEVQDGSIWLPQMAHGKSAFGENTAKILQNVKKGKKMSFYERRKNYIM